MRTDDLFLTVRTEGALLPADLLQRIAQGDAPGLTPPDYHLSGEKLNEATNRAWNRMQAAWVNFQNARKALDAADAATSITRERWLLPLFQELGYGRLAAARAQEIDGKPYAISHLWQGTPIHLVGCNVDLDRRTAGVTGASRTSPYSLLQEFLNRSKDHLWGIVSNGLCLRLLRDNISLTRQAYVEFDLEQMMTAQAYPDFVMLWLLCHESRVQAERPAECWLEKWSHSAREQGVRFLEGLRKAVQEGIEHLGQGFLAHPANAALRDRLRSGALEPQEYYRQVLRLIYRLLFLFVAEDREVLLAPSAPTAARERYLTYYATTRLRRFALRRTGSRHSDLFAGLRIVMRKLGHEGCPDLALPALGSFLFSAAALADIETCDISNYHLLDAVYALAVTRDGQSLRTVDYRNLGAEELGSVYESLLELHPEVDVGAAVFRLNLTAGSDRKKTGSYYTPTSLIQSLLDSALDPVLDEAARQPDPAAAILRLKVVDPAAGSGHFLIAAAHRVARRLAQVRTGDEEPAPDAVSTALREVISRCIFGVDVNPMEVELCKVSLWMEALEPGKPLSFLEHHIRLGNSLLGTTPALLEAPLPDEAFKPIEGDDPAICRDARKENRRDREKQVRGLFTDWAPWEQIGNLVAARVTLDNLAEETIEDVQRKERIYAEQIRSAGYLEGRFWADAWCAAFVWKKTDEFKYAITEEVLQRIRENPLSVEPWIRHEVERLAGQYRFFHWHLEYPEVFRVPASGETPDNEAAGWIGGFDVVLGNPPWERIKLQEKEWFQTRRPEIAAAPNAAARGRMIRELKEEHPALYADFHDALRQADGESHVIRDSGRYPLCGRGDVNTYAVFAEAMRTVMGPAGCVGCIVPSGIATDDTTKFFFRDLMEKRSLRSLYDFENSVGLFEGVGHGRFKFCLLTLSGNSRPAVSGAEFVFFARHTADLEEEYRRFTLSAEDLELLNPNTGTCPIFRSRRDAELTKTIYSRVPVLIREGAPDVNPWGIRFSAMFHMSSDSGLFRTREQLEGDGWELKGNVFGRDGECHLPLYEAKMMHHFTHHFGDYGMRAEGSQDTELPRIPEERLQDPAYVVLPRYWVPEWDVIKACADVPPALIQGFEERSEAMLSTLLGVWLAGYHLNHGSENFGGELLIRQYGAVGRCMVQGVGDWLTAKGLEAKYPLDEGDLDLVRLSTGFVELAERLIHKRSRKWLLAFRDITNATNERTTIFSVLPRLGVGHTSPLMYLATDPMEFIANMAALSFDWVCRQKLGGTHMTYFMLKQFPVLPPSAYTPEHRAFIEPRVLELTYTAWDIAAFARDCGYSGPPFRWDDERRFLLRCELDALYCHLYGINREDAAYILDTFPIVRRKDESRWGEYRTRRVILEIYDAMSEAQKSGQPYATRLDPPPASPLVAHPPKPSPVSEGDAR